MAIVHWHQTAEHFRLQEDERREKNWKRWGPYLSERQWGTVREDYSPDGTSWTYLPHEHSRSRAYRWGEDGLLGITDRECRLCFSFALWNGNDAILKERLYGLSGPEGNHGEDVKECYYYLDSTPTHSYMKALYKYPQSAFPYEELVEVNGERGRDAPEYELADTGVFDDNRYFDVVAEYAKAGPDDVLIRLTVTNRASVAAPIHILPTLWFRNTWRWKCASEGCWERPEIRIDGDSVLAEHATLGKFRLFAERLPRKRRKWLFTENETNKQRLFQVENDVEHCKDAFHDYIVNGDKKSVNSARTGTKAAAVYDAKIPPGESVTIRLRLTAENEISTDPFGEQFDTVFAKRLRNADEFYETLAPESGSPEEIKIHRLANAGLLWTKQFYYYAVDEWMNGDSETDPPSESRKQGRNKGWSHLYNRDVISMPDKWEYPWYAAWDLAFHMVPFARLDPKFAKRQLILFLREWYMHPNGQMPAYEWALGDVNPPVHAWACLRVYEMTGPPGHRDRVFLARTFQKLLLNFTWWVNQKDENGDHVFSGGFLGLDNIGVFDRSRPLPTGGRLEQADGTAWMAFYCASMLGMAFELASENRAYEDMASKFFEHYMAISDAMNHLGGTGLWDEQDGFYYDHLHLDGKSIPLRIRSMVGIIPLFTSLILRDEVILRMPGFRKRMNWFLEHGLQQEHMTCMDRNAEDKTRRGLRLIAIPSRERLFRVLQYVLDENEFLSDYGVRSLSKIHQDQPFVFRGGGSEHIVQYVPGESDSPMFGGNSNWRGPVWFPLNYLLIQALRRYHAFYGESFKIECPTGSGNLMTLGAVADEIRSRLVKLFLPDESGRRPCHGDEQRYQDDDNWKEHVLFYEYFHGDSGKGLGASHQTGWTALVSELLRGGSTFDT
ncbi:MAG: hypothetical protein ACI9HK_002670 [Pirellulaceae bacterium]|jgi:hypothetical protein